MNGHVSINILSIVPLPTKYNSRTGRWNVHTFNRIFVLVMLSLLLVLGAFVLIAPAAWLSLMQSIADWFRGTVFVAYSDTGRVLARVLMAIVWAALIGFLIWLELRQGSSRDIEIVHHARREHHPHQHRRRARARQGPSGCHSWRGLARKYT